MMEEEKQLLYVNVDETGKIEEIYYGFNIIPTQDFHFFFRVFQDVIDNIDTYKVVLNGMSAQLVKK